MEAWKHIAPEVPPGWRVRNEGDETASGSWAEWWNVMTSDGHDAICSAGTREEAVDLAWRNFGPTRKRYAELIALERVREVVRTTGEYNNCTLEHHDFIAAGSVLHKIRITDVDSYEEVFTVESWKGPTLCDAAWECIQALEGGE